VEELSLPPGTQVDVLVSEPMGTLLVNERMLETYLYARDKFLKPGGKMFPVSVIGSGYCCQGCTSGRV
jgi:histone-arginine methyltransferase CARM1